MKKLLLVLGFTLMLFSCTENQRARQWGGTETINLPPNTRLVNATWKDHDLWLLTTKATPNDTPKTYEFKEKSNYGLMEGKIIINEK